MNKFDKAIGKCQSSGFRTLITLDIVKTLELGKLYKEYYELSQRLDFHDNYDINSRVIDINKEIKELENE